MYCISLLPESTCNPYLGPHTPHKTHVTHSTHITFRNLHPNGLQQREFVWLMERPQLFRGRDSQHASCPGFSVADKLWAWSSSGFWRPGVMQFVRYAYRGKRTSYALAGWFALTQTCSDATKHYSSITGSESGGLGPGLAVELRKGTQQAPTCCLASNQELPPLSRDTSAKPGSSHPLTPSPTRVPCPANFQEPQCTRAG